MDVRYLRFHRLFDELPSRRPWLQPLWRAVAAFYNPVLMERDEGVASDALIRERVEAGALAPGDLVDLGDGGGWRAISDCPLVATPPRLKRRAVVAAFTVAGALGAFFAWLRPLGS
jgi:hypothetical protein